MYIFCRSTIDLRVDIFCIYSMSTYSQHTKTYIQ